MNAGEAIWKSVAAPIVKAIFENLINLGFAQK